MSHFSKVKTQLMEQVYLLDALRDLGFEPVVAEPGTALNVQGYGGRQAQAEVKIASGYGHYEIGFVRAADGSYEAVADWFLPRLSSEKQWQQSFLIIWMCHEKSNQSNLYCGQ